MVDLWFMVSLYHRKIDCVQQGEPVLRKEEDYVLITGRASLQEL